MRTRILAATLFMFAGACIAAQGHEAATPPAPAPQAAPSAPPAPVPAPAPAASPAPSLPPASDGWIDMPQSPGDWYYVSRPPFSFAAFGASESDFGFVMRCDRENRTVSLGRVSDAKTDREMRISTETGSRQFTGVPRRGSIENLIAVDLPATDALLDAMAISKGRFAVKVAGEQPLYIPSWPEVTRLIEDCR